MAHLATNYDSFQTFLGLADSYWTVDLNALNSSGVSGTAVLALNTEDDGTQYLNVAIAADGLTPEQTHFQHIHGLFDDDGNPIDSVSPTLADDADRDGIVEVLEGLPQYGDIILSLNEDGSGPVADSDGRVFFVANYDLGDDSNFFSPVSGADYTSDDLLPLNLREIVLHGVDVPDGIGEGTDGEVDGGENGFTALLPAAAGEIEIATMEEALAVFAEQRAAADDRVVLTNDDDVFDSGRGDDTVYAGNGDDTVVGGEDDDVLLGEKGADMLDGGAGNDVLYGDGVYNIAPTEFTGQLFRLYQASFDRDPDVAGFETWAELLGSSRASLGDIAAGFEGSVEFSNTFGTSDDEIYVRALYNNVLNREADDAGLEDWTSRLENGATRSEVLVGFSESREFMRDSAGDVSDWVMSLGTHDIIDGGAGTNSMVGGYFSDIFVFDSTAASSHTVADLETWDMLDFQAFGYDSADQVIDNMTQSGDDAVFVDAEVTVTLLNTDLGSVSEDMILV